MFLRIASIIFPVLVIVVIGWLYGRKVGPENRAGWTWVNLINVQLLCPLLVFSALASKDFNLAENLPLLAAAFAIVLGSGLLAWPVALLTRQQIRTFVPPMMFNNCGNMGLPLAVLAYGQIGLGPAVAMFVVSNFLHFTVGNKMVNAGVSVWGALTHPMILATAAGLLCASFNITLPSAIYLPIKMIGDASIPLMLLALGVRLVDGDFKDWKVGLLGAVARPLVGLLIALPCAWILPLTPTQHGLVFLFASLPPAVLNFIIAERYKQQPEKVASIVLIGNIASLIFVPLGLLIGLQTG
ncbi:AEC family transporter [Parvibium lacunae]|uniref:AEC family transporter n=1 Tax=Parvibium lacunae TaxID=1888893 RepID=A0A368L5E7_9BURK|nr:AEC family transporter [Parvibium lacunae]RCS58703.1 AEC family transporter [Parvibium lacunae]